VLTSGNKRSEDSDYNSNEDSNEDRAAFVDTLESTKERPAMNYIREMYKAAPDLVVTVASLLGLALVLGVTTLFVS
jgi:hypothetical protein